MSEHTEQISDSWKVFVITTAAVIYGISRVIESVACASGRTYSVDFRMIYSLSSCDCA